MVEVQPNKFLMKLDVSTFFASTYEAADKATVFYKQKCPSSMVKLTWIRN